MSVLSVRNLEVDLQDPGGPDAGRAWRVARHVLDEDETTVLFDFHDPTGAARDGLLGLGATAFGRTSAEAGLTARGRGV